jgi:hypothetical protein
MLVQLLLNLNQSQKLQLNQKLQLKNLLQLNEKYQHRKNKCLILLET